MVEYEIFTTIEAANAKNTAIDTVLYNYPNTQKATTAYRDLIKKYDENLWAGMVGDDLKNACSTMPPAEKIDYFDEPNLVPFQELIDGGWFAL